MLLLKLLGNRSHCLNCRTPTLQLQVQRCVNIWSKQGPIANGVSRNALLLSSKNFLYARNGARRWLSAVDTKRAAKSLRGTTWGDLKEIFALAAPYKGRLCLGLSMLAISSSIYLFVPRILGKLIDEFDEMKKKKEEAGTEDSASSLARYFKENPMAMLGVLFIGACAISARIYFMHTAGQLIINNLRTKVFSAVMRQDMAFFDKNKVGEMVSRLSTDSLIVGYAVSMNLSEGARALVTFFGSGALMVSVVADGSV
uniref:ABC transmembrane type-1 domain-containing protein n=1 Tax=Plectus sambesii TaxID=2011161 RepID=A0A914UM81_9BILA